MRMNFWYYACNKRTRTRACYTHVEKPSSEYNLYDADMNFINAKLCLALICFITWHVADIMHHFSFMFVVACGLMLQNPELVHLFVCVHIFFYTYLLFWTLQSVATLCHCISSKPFAYKYSCPSHCCTLNKTKKEESLEMPWYTYTTAPFFFFLRWYYSSSCLITCQAN